ncbi:MAG: branched-chain amino acid aminotransferase [Bacteroidota bacterium]|nr:branched-chain amino acid aminotransferase [Bacteroidota bacterium]
MRHEIKIEQVSNSKLPNVDIENAPFGRTFTDHMLMASFDGEAWTDVKIVPYGPLMLSPATTSLHYGQEIFEGMKAYRWANGEVKLFRPEKNMQRMNKSAVRMAMPQIDEDIFLDGIRKFVSLDQAWVPEREGSSLYLRPFMIATDEYVGVKASDTYLFMVIACPVVSYYDAPFKVKVEQYYSRATNGGTGEAKCGGNYAASLYPANLGNEAGYKQLLWTDSKEHKYIEESGTMNVFFVIDGIVVTPELNGNVLEGVTRDSVITLLKDNNYTVEERKVSVDELVAAHSAGTLQEMFGAGTAATIAIISAIGYNGVDLELPSVDDRPVSKWVLNTISDIRMGRLPDKYNWMVSID